MNESVRDPGCGFLTLAEVDRLLDETLPASRAQEFAHHVRSGCGECALLAADLDAFRTVLASGVRPEERRAFDARAPLLERRLRRSIRDGHAGAAPGRRIVAGQWGLTAAAAVLVCAVGLAFFFGEPATPGAVLVLSDGETWSIDAMPFQEPPTLRGEDTRERIWDAAASAYRAGRYDKAEKLLSSVEPGGPRDADIALYRGISLYMTGRADDAVAVLAHARALAEEQDLPVGAASWYEGLSHLSLGDVAAARAALETAHEAGGLHAGRAGMLLARLENRPR